MPRRARLYLAPLEDRLTPSGWLDTSFGSGGIANLGAFSTGTPLGVVGLPDGKIVVRTDTMRDVVGIDRLNPDGSFDATFAGGSGRFRMPFSPDFFVLGGVAAAPDGSIVF